MTPKTVFVAIVSAVGSSGVCAFLPSWTSSTTEATTRKQHIFRQPKAILIDEEEEIAVAQQRQKNKETEFWKIAPSTFYPEPRPLSPELKEAMENNKHPEENQADLGRGVSILQDWRENWFTYESPKDDPDLINEETGYAEYECDVEGEIPSDLVGTLYRNGPGKFGVNGERVQHTLDADALVYKIEIPSPPPENGSAQERTVKFLSRFVLTEHFENERKAKKFLYRGTFGTGPSSEFFDSRPKQRGLNEDPIEPSPLSKVIGGAFNTDIKNSANTQIISFGGKVLALFEAGLPHKLDPVTLETLGEDTMDGTLKSALPVKLGDDIPEEFVPDFIGGHAHTAHPQLCPDSGNLVGWHWAQLPLEKSLEVTFTEWSNKDFSKVKSSTFQIPNCSLAPHDMAITENHIVMKINALTMNELPFLMNLKGAAAALSMDGRSPVRAFIFPRPTAKTQFEPFSVDVPACFSIHFSHGYEDEETGNIVTFFSGWPPSDSKDFLGAWGGHSPDFPKIPPTFLWRLEIDPTEKRTVSLDIAPGCNNICTEHMLVHPHFNTRKARNVYGTASNLVGDSTPPNGYVKLKVETGSTAIRKKGEVNDEVDSYWFGSRYFVTEPIIVPKEGGNIENEDEAYLLGMVRDAAKKKNFLAIFDLEQDLKEGPVAKIWLKSGIPHGIHGCFAKDGCVGGSSVFC